MVGMGGIFVEVFDDVAFGICPIDRDDASKMLDMLKCSAIEGASRWHTGPSRLDNRCHVSYRGRKWIVGELR